MIILIGYKRPFTEVNRNKAALLDEVYIIFFMYHILCLTEFVPDENTRNGIGYSAISFVLLHLVCSYCVIIYFTVKR